MAHVRYSELSRELTPFRSHDIVTTNDFRISDATEVHVGGELNVGSDSTAVFLRAGVFTSPDHRLKFVGNVQPGPTITPVQAQRVNVFERSVFNLGDDDTEVRATFGGGIGVGRYGQVDVAYVWKRQFVVSLGGRF